jgi:Mg/Co/Ni transporter MgtE
VREYQYARRQTAKLSVPGLEDIFDPLPQATIDDVLEALSEETLQAILAEMPVDERFTTWRAKVRKILAGRAVEVLLPIPALASTP